MNASNPAPRPLSAARRRLRTLVLLPVLIASAFIAPAVLPSGASVPAVFQVAEAQAAPQDCYNVARRTFAVTRGNLYAAIGAIRATGGCGDTLANGICHASRQWWGGPARATVRFITVNQYSTC
ncbi:hypothetical protein [Pseudonocardia broussonetiae]|uniref:Uncharacterized protein n=1 Tax=Pseudonocardia broussonetiae TaxID=2736640 RepID=A0A6M6JNB1_9PSEU|nr:hypothetical protein [Pseudonocardia broussonetiae]QJY47929.1 hypothetical protein HOP40_20775 [Pseudonocardia broussonetiae]